MVMERWALCNSARYASQGALHYILVVGLWQRRISSFRKTHTFWHVQKSFIVDTFLFIVDMDNKCVVEDSILNTSYTQSL